MTVTNDRIQKESRDENALLLFVLKGKIKLTVGHVTQILEQEKIALINPNQTVSYKSEEEVLLVKVPVLYEFISSQICGFRVHFMRNPDFPELEQIIKDMLVSSEYNTENHSIYEYEVGYFRMLEFLISHCSDHQALAEQGKDDDRKNRIMEYIYMNYDKDISLTDLADHLYLSVGYLSRYFTKTFGMGFAQYLIRVRLNHVYDELLYSDKSITQISYDNGFKSISQFNRSFKLMYGQTPSKLRNSLPAKKEEKEPKKGAAEEIKQYVSQYLLKSSEKIDSERNIIRVSAEEKGDLYDSWYKILNVGSAAELTSSTLQEHIRMLHDSCGFYYVRFWGLFSDQIFLRESESWKVNFSKIERIFDFILGAGMKPFIDLEEKPDRINQDIHRRVRYVESNVVFESRQIWERLFSMLLSHLLQRYGAEEMSQWKIETGQYRYYRSELDNESYYFEMFDFVYETAHSMIPGIEVGGSIAAENFSINEKTEIFLNHWNSRKWKPDFLSMIVYAYETEKENKEKYAERSKDKDRIQHMAEQLREKIVWAGFDSSSLILSEWNITISERNLINLTAFKSAYMLNSIFGLYKKVRMMGYFMASDQNSEHYDSSDFLFGGNGLVTKDGIFKPSAFAFLFLNRMYPQMLACQEEYMVTTNGKNKYRILCHNLVMPNYRYYMTAEDKLDVRKIHDYFDETPPVWKKIQLQGAAHGKYRIHIQRVNPVFGSILYAWKEFGYIRSMAKEDIEYLKKTVVPKMELLEIEAENASLEFSICLEANEMTLLSIEHMG